MTLSALLLATALASQPSPLLSEGSPPPRPAPPLTAVLCFEDGHSRVQPWSEVDVEALDGLRSAWIYSEVAVPIRLPATEIAARWEEVASTLARPPESHLRVRVSVPGRRVPPETRLLAAPVDAWLEVPEASLPSWPVPPTGELAVPLDAERTWRLRLLGEGIGSWWRTVPAGQRRTHLAARPAGDVELRVVDGDGEPLDAVRVTLLEGAFGRQAPARLAVTTSDGYGTVRLPSLPDGDQLALVLAHPAHAPATVTGPPASLPDRVVLAPGSVLTGRFLDADRRPLAGVEVRVDGWLADDVPALLERSAESDASGRFRLARLPRRELALTASLDGKVPLQRRLEPEAATLDLGELFLADGLTLPLQVLDAEGHPVAGARIDATAGPWTTDGEGVARLEGLAPDGGVELTVTADGFLAQQLSAAAPWPRLLTVELTRAFRVRGRFVDADGTPHLDATVQVRSGQRYRTVALAGGHFDLSLEPGRDIELVLSAPTSRARTVSVAAGAPGEVRDLGDVSAPAGLRVTGRLVDATGTPVAGGRAWVPRPGPNGPVVAWFHGDLIEARSDAEGRFTLTGLPPGPALLRIEAPGLARTHRRISGEPEAGPIELGDVELETGATVEITGHLPDAGALARIDLRGEWRDLDMLTAPVTGGTARISHVPAGTARVTVVAHGELLCEREARVSTGDGRVEVACDTERTRVHGRVRVGEHPVGPGFLVWLPPAGEGVGAIILDRLSPGGVRQQQVHGAGRPQETVEVSEVGDFTAELAPGTWEVTWHPASGGAARPQQVGIPEASEHELVLRFRDTVVAGRVVDGEGRGVEAARVLEVGSGAMTLSDPLGGFVLSGLEPGPVRLRARLGERASETATLRLSPDEAPEPVELVLREEAGEGVPIRVVDAAGEPAEGAFVFVDTGDRGSTILTTGAGGRTAAAFPGTEPQAVRLAVHHEGRWGFTGWTGLEEAREGLLVPVAGSAALRLESDEAAGMPTIATADGWDVGLLMGRLGLRPRLAPGEPLELGGLPPGTYTVSLASSRRTVTLEADRRRELELD